MDLQFVDTRRAALESFLREVMTNYSDIALCDAFADFVSRDSIKTLIDTPTFKKRQREKFEKEFKSQVASVHTQSQPANDLLSDDE